MSNLPFLVVDSGVIRRGRPCPTNNPGASHTTGRRAAQASDSSSSSDRLPGTITSGTRSRPICLPVSEETSGPGPCGPTSAPRISSRSEEHTSELQSLMSNSYAVFCLKKKRARQALTLQLKARQSHKYIQTNTNKYK